MEFKPLALFGMPPGDELLIADESQHTACQSVAMDERSSQINVGLEGFSSKVLQRKPESHCERASGSSSDLPSLNLEDRVSATETLVNLFHKDVFLYARWLVGNEAAAEDIAQTVFLNAFRGLHNLRDQKAAKGWLFTITRNEFAAWCKRNTLALQTELPDEKASTDTSAKLTEDAEWVRHGLQSLAPEFRVVVMMFYFDQKSYHEISDELEIPIGTVMSRLSRAKSHLRTALKAVL